MKLNKVILTFAAVTSLLGMGCNKIKDFGDINADPNTTAVPSPAALLTNVEAGLGGFAANTNAGLYAQQFSETQYTEVSLYALPKLNFDGIYAASLMDLQNIININTDEATKSQAVKFGSNVNQIAIARILKAYIYWTITDRWGDIPYFDALKGEANLTPKYDKQEDIYKDLIKELKEASDQFFASGSLVTGDIVYGKDAAGKNLTVEVQQASWKKFANSLRMLIALRSSKVYPSAGQWAATEFNAAFSDADGYFANNTANFVLNYPGNVAAFRNPWYNLYNGRNDFAESKIMTDLMATLGDPRQAVFGSSTVGFPYGLTRDAAVSFYNNNSNYAKILAAAKRETNSPLTLIGASDVLLAIAEAAQRGWISGDPVQFYKTGIAASWAEWGVTGNVDNYYATAPVDLSIGNALQKIQLQQYLSWFPDGTQAWSNWRRTGVPSLTPTPNALNAGGQIPRRFTYGGNEYAVNVAAVNEAVARLAGGDTQDAKIWWDK